MPRGEFTMSMVGESFLIQKISKVFRPPHIEGGTVRSHPILLRAPPVGFPKKIALFGGIADIHDFHPGSPFYFKGLSKDQVLHAMRNYYIII